MKYWSSQTRTCRETAQRNAKLAAGKVKPRLATYAVARETNGFGIRTTTVTARLRNASNIYHTS